MSHRPETPLSLEHLRTDVLEGRVDTVIVAITDMQGRLQGKRVHAPYFLEHVVPHPTEGCNYLLAVDVDMNTVDGYAMSSWEAGYGDMVMTPDFSTLRMLPWLPGTAMVTADLAPLDRNVTVTPATDVDAVRKVEPTSTVMGLSAGETLTVRELLYGLFLRSGNDAAETLGGGIVGRDRFVRLMNQKAAALHMIDSHFTTPVGLDDAGMRTTPYDLAIAAATITTRYPALLAISGTPSMRLAETATHKAFDMTNYNRLVLPGNPYAYQGATGMKTAFTDDAGPCMVATATRGDRRLVAVVMNSDNFFADATKLLDYGFAKRVQPTSAPRR